MRRWILLYILLIAAPLFARHRPRLVPTGLSLVQQNQVIDRLELERIRDERRLAELVQSGALVPLGTGGAVTVEPQLPENRRYVRPWVAEFLDLLGREFYCATSLTLFTTPS